MGGCYIVEVFCILLFRQCRCLFNFICPRCKSVLVRFLAFYRYFGVGVRFALMILGVLFGWGIGVRELFYVVGRGRVLGVGYDFVGKVEEKISAGGVR